MRKSFSELCFFKNAVDKLGVMLVLFGIYQRFFDFLVVDEFLCFQRFGIVIIHIYFLSLKEAWSPLDSTIL